MSTRSCLYECGVMHQRLWPKAHQFRYRIFMFALDLDEIDELAATIPLFSRNRANFYQFRDRDHLADEPGMIKEKLLAHLRESDIEFPADGRVTLLTLPRILGYIFNPVSFYFCSLADGRPFCSVVQVGNTFGEMKLYLIPQPSADDIYRLRTPKHFYVSPFSDLETHFDFRLSPLTEKLQIGIDDYEAEKRVLLSALTGRRVSLTAGRLAWFLFKYPFMTLQVITLIHWQAFLLWLKRIPYIAKSANPLSQRDVLRPHASLAAKDL